MLEMWKILFIYLLHAVVIEENKKTSYFSTHNVSVLDNSNIKKYGSEKKDKLICVHAAS